MKELKKRVLLVEDNVDDEMLTMRAFNMTKIPLTVEVRRDGASALNYLKKAGTLPHIIFLDLKMPKINGIEVLQEIKKDPRLNFIPVIVVSSSTEDRDVVAAMRAGASSYMSKNSDFGGGIKDLRIAINFWTLVHKSPHLPKLK